MKKFPLKGVEKVGEAYLTAGSGSTPLHVDPYASLCTIARRLDDDTAPAGRFISVPDSKMQRPAGSTPARLSEEACATGAAGLLRVVPQPRMGFTVPAGMRCASNSKGYDPLTSHSHRQVAL